ncbi:PREDICTED: VIP36-like protein [Acropora digitifera]|uniref:VIP36-like protein n=1 Tax=Acropora digitifera TaxID=70779 RepID=UPI000779F93E|nr:PREDICTED: VIP36-like protein [Acropora digitifera]
MLLHFKVHGAGDSLFGDGFAFWYSRDRMQEGSVFGSKDFFYGLAIFFDTYSNHNGEHQHEHPYVSAMIGNGSTHYDHDSDGTHSQVAGCSHIYLNLEDVQDEMVITGELPSPSPF